MMHLFDSSAPWFAAKRYGYGAGLPIAWQGWALLIAHMALLIGLAWLFEGQVLLMLGLVAVAALVPMPIYRAKTDGGWRWRR